MNNIPTFQTVDAFVKHVGRDRFQSVLGHKPQVVSRAIRENVMPSSWFIGVRGLCNEIGAMTPEHLFKWTPSAILCEGDIKQNANGKGRFQGEASK